MGADGDLGVGELLDLFSVLVAGGAFVFVERHGFSFSVSYLLGCRMRLEDAFSGLIRLLEH